MADESQEHKQVQIRTTPWTFDRTVNLPFLITVLSALVYFALWSGKIDTRVATVENATKQIPEMAARLERMDERDEGVRRDLDRVMSEVKDN